MVICLERAAESHMAQLMPLPLTISCFSKIRIGFTFLVPAHLVCPGKGPLNGCCCCSILTSYIRSVLDKPWLAGHSLDLLIHLPRNQPSGIIVAIIPLLLFSYWCQSIRIFTTFRKKFAHWPHPSLSKGHNSSVVCKLMWQICFSYVQVP